MALDRFGRQIHYLRISLTDHCNLRCVYCMPEDMTFRPNAEMMQDDELLGLVRMFASLGFDKYRLTGGEPTVRAHIVDLVQEIAHTPGVRYISMTTNGILLARLASSLAEAGLQRVNVSLDTLDPAKFRRITRWGKLEDVWEGIQAAEEARINPRQDQCSSGARLQRERRSRLGPPDARTPLAGALYRNDAICRRHRSTAQTGDHRCRNPIADR